MNNFFKMLGEESHQLVKNIFDLIQRLLERKFIIAVYFAADKYWIMNKYSELDTNMLWLNAITDVAILTCIGLISWEKIKVSYNKQ